MKFKIVVIMGLDGCGKTTQANLLSQKLSEMGMQAEIIWLRGESYLTSPLIKIGKFVLRAPGESKRGEGIRDRSYKTYVSSKKALFRNPLARAIWKVLALFDAYLSLRFALRRIRSQAHVLIFDRYIYDTIIDIDTAFGSEGREVSKILNSDFMKVFPKPDLVILLEIDPKEAIKRKDDIPSLEYLEERFPLYSMVADTIGARRIDATQSIEEIGDEIVSLVGGILA